MNELTREHILAMPAGRELDAYIAKYVMFNHSHPLEEVKTWCKHYSTDIAAAWEVETKIDNIGQSKRESYVSALKSILLLFSTREYVESFDSIHAAPEHRCKAALLAVMGL